MVPALSHFPAENVVTKTNNNDRLLYVWESLPACEYVDTVFGSGMLIGKSPPHERVMIQIWCDHCTNRIQQQFYKALMTPHDITKRKEYLQQFYIECRALAQAMAPTNDGPYFLGQKV